MRPGEIPDFLYVTYVARNKGVVFMSEIDELRKELRDSQKQQNEINAKLLEMLTNLTAPKAEQPVNTVQKQEVVVARKNYDNLRQPRPDAMIRL